MDYKKPETFLEGAILFIDKPLTWTSFDVVNKIRKELRSNLGIKKIKVGHAGTLDPLATGLVIICTGRATKQISQFADLDKAYTADVRFGSTTPSFDLETEVDREYPWEHITPDSLRDQLKEMTGEQEQMPPMFSAKSVDGKRAYVMARKGKEVELKPSLIRISELELLETDLPDSKIHVECSKGTYIRSLARDLGERLGSGAHLTGLRRTRIGPHGLEKADTLEDFLEKIQLL